MHLGYPEADRNRSYLDYGSLAEAEADGAFLLRQDIRLLPQLFELGIHEYAELVRAGRIVPSEVDHFLCHYSSQKFAPVVDDLMQKAALAIPQERWYSNLVRRGNTGSASIFIMLADFVRERQLQPGQQILCFVPESGRFTVAFIALRVCEQGSRARHTEATAVAPPHDPATAPSALAPLLAELAGIWHEYRSRAWRTPLLQRITRGELTRDEYLRWMSCWIPQVREGSKWMRSAIDHLTPPWDALAALIAAHADDEQLDYNILFGDYRAAGGKETHLDSLRRNPGGEALNSFMFAKAAEPNPVGLLGGIYVVEGTGQRIIPALLPLLRRQLDLPERAFRFLAYHGENDAQHLTRWLRAVEIAIDLGPRDVVAAKITATARATAELYVLQLEHAL
jgi:3-oxoacyl-[acyl-carrier-protein] synthase-3